MSNRWDTIDMIVQRQWIRMQGICPLYKKGPFPPKAICYQFGWVTIAVAKNVDGIPWNDVIRASFVAKGKRTYDGGGEKHIYKLYFWKELSNYQYS